MIDDSESDRENEGEQYRGALRLVADSLDDSREAQHRGSENHGPLNQVIDHPDTPLSTATLTGGSSYARAGEDEPDNVDLRAVAPPQTLEWVGRQQFSGDLSMSLFRSPFIADQVALHVAVHR